MQARLEFAQGVKAVQADETDRIALDARRFLPIEEERRANMQ